MQMRIATIVMLAAAWAAPAEAQVYGPPLSDGRAPTVFTFDAGYELPDDAALLRSAHIRPEGPSWLRPSDYPQQALDAGITGTVKAELDIGPDDALLRCRIIEGSGFAILDDILCPILREHGIFRHALTVDGVPTSGQLRIGATFELEIPQPPSKEPVNVVMLPTAWDKEAVLAAPKKLAIRGVPTLFTTKYPGATAHISEKGLVTACRISWTTGTDEGDVRLCNYVSAARFKPALDKAGKPMASELYVAPQIIR